MPLGITTWDQMNPPVIFSRAFSLPWTGSATHSYSSGQLPLLALVGSIHTGYGFFSCYFSTNHHLKAYVYRQERKKSKSLQIKYGDKSHKWLRIFYKIQTKPVCKQVSLKVVLRLLTGHQIPKGLAPSCLFQLLFWHLPLPKTQEKGQADRVQAELGCVIVSESTKLRPWARGASHIHLSS